MRGYDPSEVEQRYAEISKALVAAGRRPPTAPSSSTAAAANTWLKESLAEQERAADADLEDAQHRAAAPSFGDLGQRIGRILTLADEEASEIRRTAAEDAEAPGATAEVAEQRQSADRRDRGARVGGGRRRACGGEGPPAGRRDPR